MKKEIYDYASSVKKIHLDLVSGYADISEKLNWEDGYFEIICIMTRWLTKAKRPYNYPVDKEMPEYIRYQFLCDKNMLVDDLQKLDLLQVKDGKIFRTELAEKLIADNSGIIEGKLYGVNIPYYTIYDFNQGSFPALKTNYILFQDEFNEYIKLHGETHIRTYLEYAREKYRDFEPRNE